MKTKFWLAALGIAVAGTLGIFTARWLTTSPSQPLPSGPPISATPAAPSLTLDQIASQLARDETRIYALDQLKAITYQQIDHLRRLEDETTNPRVKTDLEAHVIALQEQLAADPPPVSLHVKDAPMETIIADLGQAMAVNLAPFRRNPNVPPGTFTLDADRKPFWDVVQALNNQSPVVFLSDGIDHLALHDDNGGLHTAIVDGPFCVFAYMRDNQAFGRIAPATKPPLKWILRYSLGIDPRLWAILGPMKVTLGPDDAGNVFTTTDASYKPHPENLRCNTYYGEAEFTPPQKPGKFISSMKIEGTIRIVTSDQYTVVDFAQPANREFKFANTTFSVKSFASQPTQRSPLPRTDFVIVPTAPGGKPEEARIRLLDQPSVQVHASMTASSIVDYRFSFPSDPAPPLQTRSPHAAKNRGSPGLLRNPQRASPGPARLMLTTTHNA